MLILEYKLRANPAQQRAIDEAIRTVQFIRNKCLRKWMDERSIGDNDLASLLRRASPYVSLRRSAQLSGPPDRC